MDNPVPYSRTDRLLHRLAFHNNMLGDMLADLESGLYASQWRDYRAEKPIFVTSLPRAGTTIVLEVLHRLPGLAVHTYRDMPFVLTPVLWHKLSRGFHHRSAEKERAHGDGLKVNEDSPEAFEEVLWKKFFGHKYTNSNIDIWKSGDSNIEFTAYFREHMQKIVSLRQPGHTLDGRYVSKNNANIARTGFLLGMFPDAQVLVPFRDPLEHAISMWRQHQNFTSQHAEEAFVTDYMADIGHYEFGVLHKPIAMSGFTELCGDLTPESTDYWLAYWTCCFEHLLQQQDIRFVCYESLCASALDSVGKLAVDLDIPASAEEIASAAAVLRPAPAGRSDAHTFSQQILARARDVHDTLMSRCLLVH